MSKQKNTNVRILAEAAIMLALATILSMIPLFKMPLGGSVTLVSMLPVLVMAIRRGAKWGFVTSFAYAVIQIFVDLSSLVSWGLTALVFIGALLLDYLFAFGILGIAGMPVFRLHGARGAVIGISFAVFMRFIMHFISGIVLWTSFDIYGSPVIYSLAYNGTYMLPELGITLAVASIFLSVPAARKKIFMIEK